MNEQNCAFQYAKITGFIFGRNTEIVCDKSGLSEDEAKELWNEYYSDCAKHIKSGGTAEMVIWVEMIDPHSYGKYSHYISEDAESDGIVIWEIKKTYFPSKLDKQLEKATQ